jgi:tetratricopeptide (TPR) repeat protein
VRKVRPAAPTLSIEAADHWLRRARAGVARGDAAEAIRCAEAGLRTARGRAGDLLFILGRGRLMQREYQDAVDAFTAAARAPDLSTPGAVAYHRGLALMGLGRFGNAEVAFASAAVLSYELAQKAYLGAAVAAVKQEAFERAEDYLDRVDTLDDEADDDEGAQATSRVRALHERALIAAAERDAATGEWEDAKDKYESAADSAESREAPADERGRIEGGLAKASYELDDYEGAREHLQTALRLDPRNAESHLLLAQTAQELGDPLTASQHFTEALSVATRPDTAQAAEHGLFALSPGIRGRGLGIAAHATAGVGYDTDAAKSELLLDKLAGTNQGSNFGYVEASASWRFHPGTSVFSELKYDFEQTAYAQSSVEPINFQEHQMSWSWETLLGRHLRLDLPVRAGLSFTGLRHFQVFQESLGGRPALFLDESLFTSTSLAFEWTQKRAPVAENQGFSGHRAELALEQVWRVHPGTSRFVRAVALARDEVLGSELLERPSDPECATACFLRPLSYRELGLTLDGTWSLGESVEIEAAAAADWRAYRGAVARGAFVREAFVPGDHAPQPRRDLWVRPSATLTFMAGDHVGVEVSYELLMSFSTVDNTAPGHAPFDFDNLNYTKHVVSLGVVAEW